MNLYLVQWISYSFIVSSNTIENAIKVCRDRVSNKEEPYVELIGETYIVGPLIIHDGTKRRDQMSFRSNI